MLVGCEQTVSREKLMQIYVTRTVTCAGYRGSDAQFDHFTVFGMRYAVPRNENVIGEQYRFPVDSGHEVLPMGITPGVSQWQFLPQEHAEGSPGGKR